MTRTRRGSAALVVAVALLVQPPSAPGQGRGSAGAELASRAAAALDDGRFADALAGFEQAAAILPREAVVRVGAGVAAYRLGRLDEARAWMSEALRLDPRHVVAASVLGQVLYRMGLLSEAIAAYEGAATHAADDDRPELLATLAEWRAELQLHGRFYNAQGAHFSVMFEGPGDDVVARRVLELLEAAYWRVGSALNVYPARQVPVMLYTREQFRDLTRAPEWAAGVYDGRIRLPIQGALEQPLDLERILAHEFVHAVVASIGGDGVPAWLHEGLAGYFEPGGIAAAESQLAASPERVSWQRLGRSFRDLNVDEIGLAYAQSAVLVKRLIELRGAPALVALLKRLGDGTPLASALQQALFLREEDVAAMAIR
jgi:tetratricopeptide (TPR) repeat protein